MYANKMVTWRYNPKEGLTQRIRKGRTFPFAFQRKKNSKIAKFTHCFPGSTDPTTLPQFRYICLVWCGVVPLARLRSVSCPIPLNESSHETNRTNSVNVLWSFTLLKKTSFTRANFMQLLKFFNVVLYSRLSHETLRMNITLLIACGL